MPGRPITVKNTALAAVAALVVNLIIFGLGSAADATWDAGSPYPIGVPMVALFSLVPLVLAAVVVALIGARYPRFQGVAAWAGLVFALLTIAGSLTMATQTLTGLCLGAMHIVVGLAWFFLAYPGRVAGGGGAELARRVR